MKKFKVSADNVSTEPLTLKNIQLFFEDRINPVDWEKMEVGEIRKVLFYEVECMEVSYE